VALRVMVDMDGATIELVQHSACRGAHIDEGRNTSRIIDMVWLCRSPIPVERQAVFYLFK
jgi:hypothetical protein